MNLTDVPGVAETVLAHGAEIPATAPPAPWTCRCDALLWTARVNRAAARAPHPAVAALGKPVAVLGGFVRYHDTPVGPYDEVLAAVALVTRRGIRTTVPFMAVDSASSVAGGRLNWSLPKTLAEFAGGPGAGIRAEGVDWSVGATPRPARHGLPVATASLLAQYWQGGGVRSSRLRVRGRVRPALVRVSVESDGSLPEWLRPGHHLGAAFHDMTFRLDAAKEAR